MPKQDPAQIAHRVFLESIGEKPKTQPRAAPEKDAAAVELGRKGGKARAAKLNPDERSDSAKKAVQSRWHKRPE